MVFNEVPPCRDEFLIYSLIAEMRDVLLKKKYSVIIDSTAPDNVTRTFLLATKVKGVNRLVVLFNVEREVILERNIEMFGDASSVFAWDERWETPQGGIPIFKFKSNNMEEFEASYARLKRTLGKRNASLQTRISPSDSFRRNQKNTQEFLEETLVGKT